MEWYWDPYWLFFYWKSHPIIAGLMVLLVLACVSVSILGDQATHGEDRARAEAPAPSMRQAT
jgi:hypothetical protein